MKQAKFILLFFILIMANTAIAQTTLEVVTKTIEKSIAFKPGENILLLGENATINISTWAKDEVKIKIKLISKNRIKNVAVADQANIKHLIEKKGSTVYLRNYFVVQQSGSSGSILKVEYELTVPSKSNCVIKNSLGNITIDGVEGKMDIEEKFGNLNLTNCKGNISVKLNLGDMKADNLSGVISLLGTSANFNIINLSGQNTFDISNGDLFVQPLASISTLNVKAKNGEVTCSSKSITEFGYDFSSSYGEVKTPEFFKTKVKSEKTKTTFVYLEGISKKPILKIKVEFGNINLIQ